MPDDLAGREASDEETERDGAALIHRGTSWLAVLLAFAHIGATSFGGGSATIAAMRQLCLARGWLSRRRFTEVVVVSKLTPGISILAMALLIGRSVAGLPGLVGAVVGLMTPSVIITFALAWLYVGSAHLPGTASLLHALSGVAAGFAVAMVLQFLRDVSQGRLGRNMLLFAAYAVLAWLLASPLAVMGIALTMGVVAPRLFDDAAPGPGEEDRDLDP